MRDSKLKKENVLSIFNKINFEKKVPYSGIEPTSTLSKLLTSDRLTN